MRLLGIITNDNDALSAQGLLVSREINCRLEKVGGGWEVWAIDEDKLLEARTLYQQFINDPFKEHYANFAAQAREMLARVQHEQEIAAAQFARRFQDSRAVFTNLESKPAPLSWVIIFASIGAWVGQTIFPSLLPWLQGWLLMMPLEQIFASGQLWRLITPVFLHYPLHDGDMFMGILHIGMNMLWMKDLSPLVERRHGTGYLFGLFLGVAVLSNLTQYFLAGPNFLGMSGVVYGLLGFLWIRGKVDPRYGLQLNPGIVYFMLLWLGFCFLSTGVANGAHVGGLIAGAAWGYVSGTIKNSQ